MSKILDNKIILLGFIGDGTEAGDLNEEIDLNAEIGHLNCAIFEINEDRVLGKKIKQFIDWDSVRDIEKIKTDVEIIKKDINELKDKVDQIIQFINDNFKGKNKKNKTMLGKKTKRRE